jgi:hypothetical protein
MMSPRVIVTSLRNPVTPSAVYLAIDDGKHITSIILSEDDAIALVRRIAAVFTDQPTEQEQGQ